MSEFTGEYTNEYWDVCNQTMLVVPNALTTGIFEGRYDGYETNAQGDITI